MRDKVTISSIKIQTKQQEVILSLDEAREIYEELSKLFAEPKPPKVYRNKNEKQEPASIPPPWDKFPRDEPKTPWKNPDKLPWEKPPKSPFYEDWTCIRKTEKIQMLVK